MARQRIVTILVALVVLSLIGWGIWAASRPAPVVLQGQLEARTVNVASKLPGRVAKVLVEEGQQVKAGELLFEIDSPEIRAKQDQASAVHDAASAVSDKAEAGARVEEKRMAELDWKRAEAGAELAQSSFKRVDALYKEGLIARQKFDEAQTQASTAHEVALAARARYDMALAGARREDKAAAQAQVKQAAGAMAEVGAYEAETRIAAPAAGEVGKLLIHAGELAPQGFPVMTLSDLADIKLMLNVREDQLKYFPAGGEFDGELPALGKTLRFKVSYRSVLPDFATWKNVRGMGGADLRTFEVQARPTQATAELRPGMSVIVKP